MPYNGRGYTKRRRKTGSRTRRKMGKPGYTRRVGNYGRYTGKRAEHKTFSSHFTGSTIGHLGANFHNSLVTVPQGVGSTERIGRQIVVKQVQLRGQIKYQPTLSNHAYNKIRIVLALDTQANGGPQAEWSSMYQTGITGVDNIDAFPNTSNTGRYRVLKETTFALTSQIPGALTYAAVGKNINWNLRGLNIPIHFSGTTSSLANIRSNNICLLACAGNDILLASERPIFQVHFRVVYTDV